MLTRAPVRPNFVERLTLPLFNGAIALYGRYAAALGAVIFAFYILATAAIAIVRPDANWDMLAYLAVAEEGAISDPQQLHAYAYDTVKAGVSPDEYRVLVDDGGGFRSHMATNAKRFRLAAADVPRKVFLCRAAVDNELGDVAGDGDAGRLRRLGDPVWRRHSALAARRRWRWRWRHSLPGS